MTFHRHLLFVFLLCFSYSSFGQFKINQVKSNFIDLADPLFTGESEARSIFVLNSDWKVYFAEEPENFSKISFPVNFTSKQPIIFEKTFEIDSKKLLNNFVKLNFLGLNYNAEIFVNNASVYKHPGGIIPFSVELPDDILNFDTPNTLRIKIQYNLDSENTIPVLQRFLFPKDVGGILRDVYLLFRPKAGIKNFEYSIQPDSRPYSNRIDFKVHFEELTRIVNDSLLENFDNRFKLEALITKTNDTSKVYFNIWNINPIGSENYMKDFFVRLRQLTQWTIDSPSSYVISLKLTNGDGFVYDELREVITLIDIKKKGNKLFLEDKPIKTKGVTYIRDLEFNDYEAIEKDISLIKESGFNTIRFSRTFPHPYAVYLCNKYGLFSLIELPLNSIPESFTENNNFLDRSKSFLKRTISYYDNYPSVIGYGFGGSYLGNSISHQNFISKMTAALRASSKNKFSYASFIGFTNNPKLDIDFYGIEIYRSDIFKQFEEFTSSESNDSLIYFISEATYPTYKGATNGYLNTFSFEGQAKFFDDVITFSKESNLQGFVLNTMFDYSGDFSPFYSGYDLDKNYNIGILAKDGNKSRISFNLIKSRLTSGSNVTVPIGNNNEDAPLFFIITALIISIIIALLINSKRKFREDATRALLRPYNFFADIRDQRILTGFHSNILMFLLSGANALVITILLFFLKNNILLEKFVLSFGNYNLSETVSYLAWNPQKAFIYAYIGTIILFIIISFLVHLSSFFVKTKVLFSSVYSVAIWAFLPLALLLPIEAVLYKILLTQSYNFIIYGILVLSLVWNLQRFLKGIYVIFDVRPLLVYSYAILVLLLIGLATGLYFQYTSSAFNYIELAIKQYILL
ncbi:MAG: hypothetical protein OQJ81_09015 [Melioribacteraceae bacterium]|nr:hypothetical protein [Melioribacteraceae bacterium]